MTLTATGRSRLLCAALAVVIGVVSSGCYFRLLQITVDSVPGGYPDYEDRTNVTIGAGSLVANCTFDTEFFNDSANPFGCIYSIYDEQGFLVDLTSTAELISEYGIFGALIDPLILQVPAGLGGVSGTVDGGAGSVPLIITPTNSFLAGPKNLITPEPGMQFLIVELPDSIANNVTATDPADGQPLDFALQFSPSQLPIPIKSMFTIRIDDPEGTYYLPMLPCTTDFADIPATEISLASALSAEEDARSLAATYATQTCDSQVYDLRTIPAPGDPGVHALIVPGLAVN